MQHSASSIALANRCHRAWWHCYRDKLRPPELAWKLVKRMRARNQALPAGAYGKALGTEMHRLAEMYLTLPPRKAARQIDWTDLPGQCLAEILPYLPPAGSLRRSQVERAVSVKVDGVAFRGLIDVVGAALARVVEVYDHKSTRDIRAYAKLPHAVAVQIKQPERSLRDDLQSCLYVLARAKKAEPAAVGGLARWNYTETQRTRRALPVVQYIPTAHARTVVASAAKVARTVEAFETIDDAVPNTLACDQFGGCWYRHEGHCRVRRNMGAVFAQSEREAREKANMGKPLTFQSLGIATTKANKAEEAKAKSATAAPVKRKPAPALVVEDTEDDADDSEDEEAPPPPVKAKRKAAHAPLPPPVDEDGEVEEDEPAPVAKSPRAAAKQAFDAASTVAEPILQYFGAASRGASIKGEAKILATAFAELAEHLSANLPRNPERAQCLRKLLEANDCALRAATAEA